MLKRSVATIIAALSIPLLGGVAIAVANSVDTNPAPASITHTTVEDHGGLTPTSGTDASTTTSSTSIDDHGGVTGGDGTDDASTTTSPTSIDDHGGLTGGNGTDDGSGHGGSHG